LGKIPTTLVRRLISLFTRSSGLVDQIFFQWAWGEGGEGADVGRCVSEHLLDCGELAAELAGDGVELVCHRGGVWLGEHGADGGGDHLG
jgi:hypothetical protein